MSAQATLIPTPAPRPGARLRRGRSKARAPVARKPCPLAPRERRPALPPFAPFSHREKVPDGRMRVRRHAHAAIGRDQASPLTNYTARPSTDQRRTITAATESGTDMAQTISAITALTSTQRS
ncbi:hypothetical protein XarbCFBP8152_18475 [Xanthomonas arboricola]|nr:hypothetical protein XarbCFBP8152_18475 [Xanthomonas arboricola]